MNRKLPFLCSPILCSITGCWDQLIFADPAPLSSAAGTDIRSLRLARAESRPNRSHSRRFCQNVRRTARFCAGSGGRSRAQRQERDHQRGCAGPSATGSARGAGQCGARGGRRWRCCPLTSAPASEQVLPRRSARLWRVPAAVGRAASAADRTAERHLLTSCPSTQVRAGIDSSGGTGRDGRTAAAVRAGTDGPRRRYGPGRTDGRRRYGPNRAVRTCSARPHAEIEVARLPTFFTRCAVAIRRLLLQLRLKAKKDICCVLNR